VTGSKPAKSNDEYRGASYSGTFKHSMTGDNERPAYIIFHTTPEQYVCQTVWVSDVYNRCFKEIYPMMMQNVEAVDIIYTSITL
jgi:hypothetical protein